MKIQHQIKQGDSFQVTIKRLGINGEGIGFHKKTIVFVPGSLPKETVLVKASSIAPKFVEADLIKVLKKSKHRILPPCPVYKKCGGCQLQHLAYPEQLIFKNDIVKQALIKYKPNGYQNYLLKPTIGMSEPWHYRNKLQFQIRKDENEKVICGLYESNSHKLVPIDDCLVQDKATTNVINAIVSFLSELKIPIYDEQQNSGIIKTVMVRIGVQTGELQVVFITHSPKLPAKRQLLEKITTQLPDVVSVMQNIQNKKTSQIMGEKTVHLWGKESIEETLNQVTFDLSARAFFQLNPKQTEVLYQQAIQALDPKASDHVIDAYCGVGTIGLALAPFVKEVRGMDIIPSAVEDAKFNAKRLQLTNTFYEAGTAEVLIPEWLQSGFSVDGLIVDPPRTGLDKKLLSCILANPIAKIVYISCNPSTFARDMVELSKKYRVEYLQSVDMFPQTARAEVVAKLTLKNPL